MPVWETLVFTCKIQNQPTAPHRYDQSAAIWVQKTMAFLDKCSTSFGPSSGQITMGIKSVTSQVAEFLPA